MQPLPSWLPTTQRHLGALTAEPNLSPSPNSIPNSIPNPNPNQGALTAELMQGDGGPVCFGNTVTLRGHGDRCVDVANPITNPNPNPDPDPNPNPNSNP